MSSSISRRCLSRVGVPLSVLWVLFTCVSVARQSPDVSLLVWMFVVGFFLLVLLLAILVVLLVLDVVAVVVSVISLWLWCRTLVVGFFVRGCFLLFLVCLVGFLSIRVMIARRVGCSLSCFVGVCRFGGNV